MTESIYHLARVAIETKQQWEASQSVTIWEGRAHKVTVSEGGRDGGGLLYLGFFNGKPGENALVLCGYLNPLEGWVFSLDQRVYAKWVKDATAILEGHNG